MNPDWIDRKERGTPFMVNLIRWIALHLGRRTARLTLHPIALYFFLFGPSVRHASRDYLQRVSTKSVRWWHIIRHIHTFSATILDRVFLLTGRFSEFDVRIHGIEQVESQLKKGKGCILMGSHIGSFEVLRATAVDAHKFPMKILMQEAHSETLTRILHALNPDIAESVIQLGTPTSLLAVQEYLQKGYMIGMLGDRVADPQKTVVCRVINADAQFPTGPMLTASVLKVPVVLFFGIYKGGNRYDIYFEPFAEQVRISRTDRQGGLLFWTQQYADRLTHHAHESPYNWFNFYEYWKQ